MVLSSADMTAVAKVQISQDLARGSFRTGVGTRRHQSEYVNPSTAEEVKNIIIDNERIFESQVLKAYNFPTCPTVRKGIK